MTTATEQRLIRTYVLMPRLASASLLTMFLAGATFILCVMIDDVFLNAQGFYEIGMYGSMAVMLACGALAIVFALKPRLGMNKPAWIDLVARARTEQAHTSPGAQTAVAGGVALGMAGRLSEALDADGDNDSFSEAAQAVGAVIATAGFIGMMRALSRHAQAVGEALGVPLPRPGRYIAAAVLIPCLAVVALWIPRMASSVSASKASQEAAYGTVQTVRRALEPACTDVTFDDPHERFRDSGYQVRGRLRGYGAEFDGNVTVTVGNDGRVEEIRYSSDVDVTLPPEENLERAVADMAALHDALIQANVEVADAGLLAEPTIPAEFAKRVKASYYEEFFLDIEDTGTLEVWMTYATDTEEEFDEYSDPCISLVLEAA